jgi:penicillin-binding protein 1A
VLPMHNRHYEKRLASVPPPDSRAAGWVGKVRERAVATVRQFRNDHPVGLRWAMRSLIGAASFALFNTALVLVMGLHYIYFDRSNLPDIEPFLQFEFPAIGRVYDISGSPLIEIAKEHRHIVRYQDIPPVVRDAVLAAEDRNFFSHSGVDYACIPRVLSSVRLGALVTRVERMGRKDKSDSLVMFRRGGSTISQQLVRAYFLRGLTDRENSNDLRPGLLSFVIGARSAKKLARKVEEVRLSVWMEDEMQDRFGSKRRAKEEILARYVSFLYMGDGQYGFAAASEHYFGRPL